MKRSHPRKDEMVLMAFEFREEGLSHARIAAIITEKIGPCGKSTVSDWLKPHVKERRPDGRDELLALWGRSQELQQTIGT